MWVRTNPDLAQLSYQASEGLHGFWADFMEGTTAYQDWRQGGAGRRETGAVWINLENDFDHPFVWIENLGCNERGKGLATKALTWLCEIADRWGVELRLHAESLDREGLSTRQLRGWYGRHGFRPVPGRATTMRRRPAR